MAILKVRYYQLKRDLGLLFFIIVALLMATSYFFFNHPMHYGYYVCGIILYLFYNFHRNRKDLAFLQKHFSNVNSQVISEYQLFMLPFSLPSLFTEYWYCFFILHFAVLCFPFLNLQSKWQFRFNFITRYLGNDYVFISGIRKNLFVIIVLLLISILLSPVMLFPLVALFLLNSVIFSFFEINEGVQMLQATGVNSKQFLNQMSFSAIKKMLIVNVPVLLINTCFNSGSGIFNLYFVVYCSLTLATVICVKYEDYTYGKTGNNFQAKLIIMILGLFIPYLSPLAILFYFQSRARAIKNLNKYLDAVN